MTCQHVSMRRGTAALRIAATLAAVLLYVTTVQTLRAAEGESLATRRVSEVFHAEILEEYNIPGDLRVEEVFRAEVIEEIETYGVSGTRLVVEILRTEIIEEYQISGSRTVAEIIRTEVIVVLPEYEFPGNRPVAEVLRPAVITGPHYQVQDPVVAYFYEHHYTVTSDFGTFEVTGDSALRKLLREIHAIASLHEVKKSKVYLESLVQAAKRPLELGKNLITHPVDTVTGVPKGVWTLFGNIGEGIATTVTGGTDPSEDNRAKQILQVSAYKREWADKLGVDPYSSNKVLQKELNSVGWAGALGSLTLSVATMPASAPAMTALKMARMADQMTEIAEQRGDFGDRINKMVAELPPARMRIDNEKKLSAMGISKALATRYLDHPHFTPRHDAVIVESLHTLKEASGRGLFFRLALAVDSEAEADFVMNIAQTLRGYQLTTAPITTIRIVPPFVVTTTAKGGTFVPFPIDHGVWSIRAEQAVQQLQQAAGEGSAIELWVTGTLSPLARLQFKNRGIVVRENIDTRITFID